MINFTEDPLEDDNQDTIRIRNIREITGVDSLKQHFSKELKRLSIDDVFQPNLSLHSLALLIKGMRPNTIVLQNGKSFLIVETDIMLREYVAIRSGKMICSGTMIQCQKAMVKQIRKEFKEKFDQLEPEEVDDLWLKNFSKIHFNKPNMYKIIKI